MRCSCRHSRRRLQQAHLRALAAVLLRTLQLPQRLPVCRRTPPGRVFSGRRAERQRSGPSCVREMVGARCALFAPRTVGCILSAASCRDQLSAALGQIMSTPFTRGCRRCTRCMSLSAARASPAMRRSWSGGSLETPPSARSSPSRHAAQVCVMCLLPSACTGQQHVACISLHACQCLNCACISGL